MFERFTDHARRVVVLAQEEARTLGQHRIGTEHLLLGLLREEEGLAARVLGSLDVTIEAVRDRMMRTVDPGEASTPVQIPVTQGAKKVLELSLREALRLRHDYIGTEHILLALTREGDGRAWPLRHRAKLEREDHADVARRILSDLGADPERIRNETTRVLFQGLTPRGAGRSRRR